MPEIAFIVGWAVVIVAVGAWAARANRRWVVTTAAAFGAIEFYTQWFERLGAEPWAIIIGGLTVVAFAIALWRSRSRSPRDGHRLSQKPGLNTGASRVWNCHTRQRLNGPPLLSLALTHGVRFGWRARTRSFAARTASC